MHPIQIPNCYKQKFDLIYHEEYKLNVHFFRASWYGRMKACRGVGASLSEKELQLWESEHLKMLSEIAPEEFDIKHYAAFQSVHHVTFILCYTVLYDFFGLCSATVGAKRTSTGCPAPLYLPLSEFVNTGRTI